MENNYEEKNSSTLITDNLGLIILIFISIVYLILSFNVGFKIEFLYGKVIGYYTIFLLIYWFLKTRKVNNLINYSSIFPLILFFLQFPPIYDKYLEKEDLNLFTKGLTKIEKKWFEQDVSDKNIREGYNEDVNDYIDSFLRKLKGKTRDIIKEVKIIKNKQFKLEGDFFESQKKIKEMDLLTFSIQNIEDINRYIDSTEKMIEHINNRKDISTKIRDSYLLQKRYGLELQEVTEIHWSYVNNEISENEYNELIEKSFKKLIKTEEEMIQ
jgi:hypothetical protein